MEEIKKADTEIVKYEPTVANSDEVLFDNPWLKVKKTGNFIYSERKGVDSVAFILLANNASDEKRIGLINEYKDPLHKFLTTAFGGSIDDEKYHEDLRILVKDETVEEAGFDVNLSDIKYYGKVIISTQSNQFCHLFAVELDKTKQVERTTTNPTEMKSSVEWMTIPEAMKLQDWKAPTIISKRIAEKNAVTYIRQPK